MKLDTVGPIPFDAALARAEVRRLQQMSHDEPLLGIAFLPEDVDAEPWLAAIGEEIQAPVVGATTGGAAFTERGFTEDGAVIGLLRGDATARVSLATDIGKGPLPTMRAALRRLAPINARYASVLVFADAFACDGEDIVEALRLELPSHCQAFGGTAGDSFRLQRTRVFYQGRSWGDTAVFVLIEPNTRFGVEALHGWRPAEHARELEVTEIDKNVIKTFNHRNAAEVYAEELRRLHFLGPDEPLSPQITALYELGVRTPFREQLKIRAALNISPEGWVTLAGNLKKGDLVRIVTTSNDRLIEAASTLSSTALAKAAPKGPPGGALVFDCAARKMLLGQRYQDQIEAFRGNRGTPLLGMACYGEIGRFGGAVEGFHNTTAVMAAW